MSEVRYRLMALGGVVCISFAPILVRAAATDAVTIAFFRSIYALPFLAVLWWLTRRHDHRPRRSRLIAVGGGVFLAFDLTFWHTSIEHIGAGLATVVVNLQVVIVALIAWAIFGEKPGRRAIALVPLMLFGVVLISGVGGADTYGTNPLLGTLQSVLAACFYSLYLLLLRQSGRGHASPPTGPVFDATVGTAIAALIIGLGFRPEFSLAVTWPTHGWLLTMAIVSQVIGWLLITLALPNLPAVDTSILLLGQPMLAILWARLIYAETLGLGQWVGVAVVLAGLLAFSLTNSNRGSDEARQESVEPAEDPA